MSGEIIQVGKKPELISQAKIADRKNFDKDFFYKSARKKFSQKPHKLRGFKNAGRGKNSGRQTPS